MDPSNPAYSKLQKHLNRQAVGFPATRTQVELNMLRHIFTPQQARLATCLSYRMEPLETILVRAGHLVGTMKELERQLDRIHHNGGIECRFENGRKLYANAPLVVGMYEFQAPRLTPQFIKDFNTYTNSRPFGIEFLSTELPQMRTIPIAKSIRVTHQARPFDQVEKLLLASSPPFVVVECICRKKKALEGAACKCTDRTETCLAMGSMAQSVRMAGYGREISRQEALSILEKNQRQGMVLQPSNTEQADFICSCCGCCCGMLQMHQALPMPLQYWAANYHASIDAARCNGCGACQQRCQVGAVTISAKDRPARVDLNRCLGCGVCIPTCPHNAIQLEKKRNETRPPATREALYDAIMAKKKSRLGKMKLFGKLLVDAIRTGNLHLIK